MERNYTKSIRNGFYDMAEQDIEKIWNELGDRGALIKSGAWKEYFHDVVSHYRLSCRFAFMRILFEREKHLPLSQINEEVLTEGFSVDGIGHFSEISIKHAEQMGAEEVGKYKQLLLRRVKKNNPDYAKEAEGLINSAMSLAKAGEKSCLNRNKIIRLGHMVNFSLDEMQFILLRVLGDNEAGFVYSSSSDVIDMYGFTTQAKLADIEEIKNWYVSFSRKIPKVDYEKKAVYCTHNIANAVKNTFQEMDVNKFKHWLCQMAPELDTESHTLRRIYLNLAAYAYAVSRYGQVKYVDSDVRIGTGFRSDMEQVAAQKSYTNYALELFGTNAKPAKEKCIEVAEALAYENAEFATNYGTDFLPEQNGNEKRVLHESVVSKHYEEGYVGQTVDENWFHFPSVTKKGIIKLSRCKQRMMNIFQKQAQPTKCDLLYLLWVIAIFWSTDIVTEKDREYFMDDFLASATCLLNAAFIPDFYPPNVFEETILLSLAMQNEDHNPAMVYESICMELVDTNGAGMPVGAKKKTAKEQKEIAEWYYDHEAEYQTKTACKQACAALYKIGESTVENYCRKFPRQNVSNKLSR